MDYLVNTPSHCWGGIAETTVEDLLYNANDWRKRLYDRKMLVLKGLRELDQATYWKLHTIWGKPWTAEQYTRTTEKWDEFEPGKALTQYGNQITKEAIGNRQMPWHRDIPWHRHMRYPIRSLYPIRMTKGAGATGTRFCDCDVLWQRLSADNKEFMRSTNLLIQNWYQFQHKFAKPETRWIPLVEKHPETARESVLLNSFGTMQAPIDGKPSPFEFGTAPGGTWIQRATIKQQGASLEFNGLSWLNYLHQMAATTDNIYTHVWEQGDLVLFDNYSGVFHGRDRVMAQPDAERLFWRMNVQHAWQPSEK